MSDATQNGAAAPQPRGGAALATFALVLTGVLQLALLALLARTLTLAEFEAAQLLVLVSTTIGVIAPLGVPTALTVFLPRRPVEESRALGWWCTVLLGGLALPWAAALFLLAGPIGGDDPVLVYGFRLLAAFVLADLPSQALPAWQLALGRHASYFRTTLAFAATRLLSLAVPALLGASVARIFELYVLVAVARLAWCVVVFLGLERGRLGAGTLRGGELVRFGIPVSLSFMVNKLNVQVDKYLVKLVAPPGAFAIYTLGAVEIPLVANLAYSATTTIVPALSRAHHAGDRAGFVRIWHAMAAKVGLFMMPAFWFFMLFAEPAMRVLFTAGFAEAVIPFRIYLLLLPLRVCAYSGIIRAMGESRPVVTSSVVAFLLNAALAVPLWYLLGLAGPAVATVIAQVLSVGVLLRVIRDRLGLRWYQLLPYPTLARTFVVAGLAALPAALALLLPDDGLRLLAGAGLLLTGYLAVGRASGVLTAEDLAALRDLLVLKGLRERAAAGEEGRGV
jgi:O-antigen/teichoic acid export membrane protein